VGLSVDTDLVFPSASSLRGDTEAHTLMASAQMSWSKELGGNPRQFVPILMDEMV